jgi:hypothetical protein
MELFQKITWEYEDKKYEIRILFEDHLINILTFLNNYPANGFRYQIQLPKNAEIQKFLKIEKFTHIIENAKEDIKNERWKHFSG